MKGGIVLSLRPAVLALALLLPLLLSAAPQPVAAAIADERAASSAPAPPVFDRGMMLIGCMGGLALGTVSVVLPPVVGWAAAGVWMGGLGTMIARAGFGCAYGSLGGAVASLARATLGWIDATWRAWHGHPLTRPLPIEGTIGS